MTTTHPILPLAQLAANFRRLGLAETARLVELEAERLAEQFGGLQEWKHSPRAVLPWLDGYSITLRQHAAHAERIGDCCGQVGYLLAVSVLAQGVAERAQLTPANTESLVTKVRRSVDAAFSRINSTRDNEWRAARFSAEQRWQEAKRATLAGQARERQVAELEMTKARLETALAR